MVFKTNITQLSKMNDLSSLITTTSTTSTRSFTQSEYQELYQTILTSMLRHNNDYDYDDDLTIQPNNIQDENHTENVIKYALLSICILLILSGMIMMLEYNDYYNKYSGDNTHEKYYYNVKGNNTKHDDYYDYDEEENVVSTGSSSSTSPPSTPKQKELETFEVIPIVKKLKERKVNAEKPFPNDEITNYILRAKGVCASPKRKPVMSRIRSNTDVSIDVADENDTQIHKKPTDKTYTTHIKTTVKNHMDVLKVKNRIRNKNRSTSFDIVVNSPSIKPTNLHSTPPSIQSSNPPSLPSSIPSSNLPSATSSPFITSQKITASIANFETAVERNSMKKIELLEPIDLSEKKTN